jgi:CubicO group peptidase (beta-lactamase class C family)
VSRGSKVEWAGGFGSADLAEKVPATARTVYQIGSVTKTFTAALVMQLAQEGRLGLSDRVGQFVHGLPYHCPHNFAHHVK